VGFVQDLTPIGDIILHQLFIQWVGDSQPADKYESGDIFVAIVHFGQLALEEVDVRLETVVGSHLDGKEVVVVLLECQAGGVLREEQLDEILKVVD